MRRLFFIIARSAAAHLAYSKERQELSERLTDRTDDLVVRLMASRKVLNVRAEF